VGYSNRLPPRWRGQGVQVGMKPSKYTLVYSAEALDDAIKLVQQLTHPKLAALASAFDTAVEFLSREFTDNAATPASRPLPITIGLWDLGAWLGGLHRIVEAMNDAQGVFIFFEVKASVPVGLAKAREVVETRFATEAPGMTLNADDRHAMKQELDANVIANDFFELAEPIRKDLGIDFIVGITPSMIAGYQGKKVYWNRISTFADHTILVSTYQLREFAEETGRPFEAFIAGIIIAQMLVAKFTPDLAFHDNRGCMFDYNADRVSIMEKAHDLKIEPDCMEAIDATYRPAVQALVGLLRNFKQE
jgi:hypothetical protein